MSKQIKNQDRRRAFIKKSGEILELKAGPDLANQVSSLYLGIELTAGDVMQLQESEKSYIDFMREDIGTEITQEELGNFPKTLSGEPIIAGWYLNHSEFKKPVYNAMVAISKMGVANNLYPLSQEQIEKVFYDSFDRVIVSGRELDLDMVSTVEMQEIIISFLDNFDRLLKEFKKK